MLEVVVIGAGFGGLAAVRGLAKAPAHVTLIDRTNHHLFQPLLYQVATAAVSPADVAVPIRTLFRDQANVDVLMDEIVGIDIDKRVAYGRRGEYPYDFLIVAAGSRYHYFGHDDWAERTLALKTLEDALEMREHILGAFEQAEMTASGDERRRLMTFVIIGGGPTGVELAGALAELARSALARDFRRIDPGNAEILLLEAGPTLLAGFPERLRRYTLSILERKGVTIRTGTRVDEISGGKVRIRDAEEESTLEAATVIWAAGTNANIDPEWLGVEVDRAGRVVVGGDLSVPGHPEIFTIGDAAHRVDASGDPLPAVAPVAKQQGAFVATVIGGRLAGAARARHFRYRDEGMLATIGRGAAIANLHWIKLTGWIAWIFWGLIHIYFLIGFRNRMMVFLNWLWAYFTYGLGARLITRSRDRPSGGAAGPGDAGGLSRPARTMPGGSPPRPDRSRSR